MMLRSILFLIAMTVLAQPAIAQVASIIAAGPLVVVDKTTTTQKLIIHSGQQYKAPDGKSLTLTVNGISMPLEPGTYDGNVVLTVTDLIPVKYKDLDPHAFRTALYVQDGKPVASKSVSAAVKGGSVGAGQASGLTISSRAPEFNGVIVTGDGKYTLDNPVIDMTGNGGNDFAGFGAAIMASGKADLTVNNPKIRTKGAVRTALFIGGNATMRVNGADIYTQNGTLPADYKFTIQVGKMMEVPWMLGLTGNVRTSNLVDYGTLYVTNSRIRSQGWGVMSTDDTARVRMYVKDSVIETIESGYGAYSIGDSLDHFSNTKINVADIGIIMAGPGSATLTDGSVINSGRYGVMMHTGGGGGALIIDKGSAIISKKTAIQSKGNGVTITVDNARIEAGNGIILQGMENDDPFMVAIERGETPPGMPPGGFGPPPGGPGGPPPGIGPPPPGGPGGPIIGMQGPPGAIGPGGFMNAPNPDIVARFNNVDLKGDFWNGRSKQGAMRLDFASARITGRISMSTTAPASGKEPVRATLTEIGNVVNTAGPAKDKHGMVVTLGAGSTWTVTAVSYLTELVVRPGASVAAPSGKKIAFTVNGKKAKLRAGSYKGNLVLTPQ